MPAASDGLKSGDVTGRIIGPAYAVHNELGFGFGEKVYENSLAIELTRQGLKVRQQCPMVVRYKNAVVGEYQADLVVDENVVVELKAVQKLDAAHEVQLVNYLPATRIEVGLLINFGKRVEVRRRILTPGQKRSE